MAAEGITTIQSDFGPDETIARLESAIKARGMTIFGRVDHAAGASSVGLALRPTTLLIFGGARAGTPLMQADQTMGLDLPLKALVFEDEGGRTWLSTSDPGWLAQRHGLGADLAPTVDAMKSALAAVAKAATTP
jgi:uncharacterized protein (DUF302 family)